MVSLFGDAGSYYCTLLRSVVGEPDIEFIDESDVLRSVSSLGPVGMTGVVLSPNIL